MVDPYVRESRPGIVKNRDIYWRDDVESSADSVEEDRAAKQQENLVHVASPPQRLSHEASGAEGETPAIDNLVPAIEFWGGRHDIDVCWDSRLIPVPCGGDIVLAKADLETFFETNLPAPPSTNGRNSACRSDKDPSVVALHAAHGEPDAENASTDTTISDGDAEKDDEYPAARGRAQHSVLDWKDFLIDCARVR